MTRMLCWTHQDVNSSRQPDVGYSLTSRTGMDQLYSGRYSSSVPATREAPLYQQVARRLTVELIPALQPGGRLPSERVLSERLGVSRVTLRAALALLASQGSLSSSAARGWFLVDQASDTDHQLPPLAGFTDAAATLGQRTAAQVLHAAVRPATLDEAELFGSVAGSAVFQLRRLRFLNDLVIAVDDSRLPAHLCPGILDHDFAHESLYRVLRNAPEPVLPTVADYSVEAIAATPEEAQLLDLPAAMPLLVATQRTRDQYDRIFELGITRYRGDRYRFRASLGLQPHG